MIDNHKITGVLYQKVSEKYISLIVRQIAKMILLAKGEQWLGG